MVAPRDWNERKTHYARFEGGPRDATQTVVLALDSGQPPDVLLTPGRREWIYLLAGGPREDGSFPYLWMPKSKIAALRQLGRRVGAPEEIPARGSR